MSVIYFRGEMPGVLTFVIPPSGAVNQENNPLNK